MDTDMKWFGIIMIAVLVIPMIGLGIDKYQINQCRTEAIRANMPAEQIKELCK